MKAHPSSAMLHVRLKRSALRRFFRTRIQKHHDLIRSKKVGIQIVPIGCGVEAEAVFRRHFRKPPLGFMDKADMCRIFFGGKERYHSEPWLPVLGAKSRTAIDERCNAQCFEGTHASAPTRPRSRLDPLPKLLLSDDGDPVSQLGEASSLYQFGATGLAGDLEPVGPPSHEHIGRASGLRLHDRAGLTGRGDGLAPRTAQESGEGEPLSPETLDAAYRQLLRTMPQGSNELAGGLVAAAAGAQAAVNDLLQVVAAGKATNVATAHGTRDVAAQQHRRQLADLIDVVALLPLPDPSPRDLRRRVEEVEGIGGDTPAIALMPGDAEVAQLQLLVLAHEHVERRQVTV